MRALPLFLLVIVGCHSTGGRAEPETSETLGDSLVLERTVCFGFCPQYRVSIARGGQVRFESRNPQDSGRVAEAVANPGAVDSLFGRAATLNLDSLPPRLMGQSPYCKLVATDMPTAIISWYRPGGAVRVEDYQGCFVRNDSSATHVIQRLRDFEAALDSVAGTARWITKPTRR